MKYKFAAYLCVVIMTAMSLLVSVVVFIPKVNTSSYKPPKCTASVIASKTADGFYCYVLGKGIPIQKLSESKFRIMYKSWSCDIDTWNAKNFTKLNLSWKDIFETNITVLSKRTVFSPSTLRKKMGVLPEDGTPVSLVARQGNVNIPDENVIIRLNNHGPLDARTTMIMTWSHHINSIASSACVQPNKEIIAWTNWHRGREWRNNGLWNTSIPLVIPEDQWYLRTLRYYNGPLFFMKGTYISGRFAECDPKDGIGLGAINRVAHLRGDITTVGFSTTLDKYNSKQIMRFELLAHKLAWLYFVVKEVTDAGHKFYRQK